LRIPADQGRTTLLPVLLMVVAFAVTQGGWLVIRHLLSSASLAAVPSIAAERADHLHLGELVLQLGSLVTPVGLPYLPAFLRHNAVVAMTHLQDVALVAATVGGAVFLQRGKQAHSLAVAVTLGMVFGGVLLVVATFRFRHSYVPAFPRYGLSMLPAAVAVLAAAARGRWALGALGGLALMSFAVVLYYLVGGSG